VTDAAVVVIGSGPCGAAAAARLVDRGADVVLLDAGLRAPRGLIVRAGGHTVMRRKGWSDYSHDRLDPASGEGVEWYSSLSLGGLSNYWTAAVPRFAPEDFTEGARIDERYVWPVTYEDLEPFYADVEKELTVTTGEAEISGVPPNDARFTHRLPEDWKAIAAAATDQGHGVGALPMAKGHPWMAARRGTEFSSYHCMLRPRLGAPNLRLVTGAYALKLNWSSATGRVESVDYQDRRTGRVENVRARAVVVAAGAIDSTVVLMRSTSSDFPHGLGNTAGLLGRYLHDHPRQWWTANPQRPLTSLGHPVYVARDGYDASPPLMASSLTIGLSSMRDRLRSFYRGRSDVFGVQVFGTMIPTDELGVVLPDGDGDPGRSRPVISLRYDSAAIDNMVTARERLRVVLATAGLGVEIPGPFHELRPGSSVHFGGTVRMHDNPELGMLDCWNRLYDVPNVIVADSSCFTTGPEKNPTLTAMALATRAADHLVTELSAG
jgi:choline dehydrogenase-like flavoprotein